VVVQTNRMASSCDMGGATAVAGKREHFVIRHGLYWCTQAAAGLASELSSACPSAAAVNRLQKALDCSEKIVATLRDAYTGFGALPIDPRSCPNPAIKDDVGNGLGGPDIVEWRLVGGDTRFACSARDALRYFHDCSEAWDGEGSFTMFCPFTNEAIAPPFDTHFRWVVEQ
jgi:hypothetical protein